MRNYYQARHQWCTKTVVFGLLFIGLTIFVNKAHAAETLTLTGRVTYPDGSRVDSGFISAAIFPFDEELNADSLITDGKYSLKLRAGTHYTLWAASYRDISDGYESHITLYFPQEIRTANLNIIVYRCKSCFHQSGDAIYDPLGSLTEPYDRLGSWMLPAGATSGLTTLGVRSGFDLPSSVSSRVIDGTTLALSIKGGNGGAVALNSPLQLSLPIATKRLGALHIAPADVRFAEYNYSTKKWVNLPTVIEDTYPTSTNDGLTFESSVDHLGTFALIGVRKFTYEVVSAIRIASTGSVRVTDSLGKRIASFEPYGKAYRGKFYVTTGDINGDNDDEIATLQATASRPLLKVFSKNGKLLASRSMPITSNGAPISLAIQDLKRDGRNEVVMGWRGGEPLTLGYAFFPNKLYDYANEIPNVGKSRNVYGE